MGALLGQTGQAGTVRIGAEASAGGWGDDIPGGDSSELTQPRSARPARFVGEFDTSSDNQLSPSGYTSSSESLAHQGTPVSRNLDDINWDRVIDSGTGLGSYFSSNMSMNGVASVNYAAFPLTEGLAAAQGIDPTDINMQAELERVGINKVNAEVSAVLVARPGMTRADRAAEIAMRMGSDFQDEFNSSPTLRSRVFDKVTGLKDGQLINISDFWSESVNNARARAIKEYPAASYNDHLLNDILSKDSKAPPALQAKAKRGYWINIALFVTSFGGPKTPLRGSAPTTVDTGTSLARIGDRKISQALYNELRTATPTASIRDAVNEGKIFPHADEALPGFTVTRRLHADHIVSMDTITKMNGFDLLNKEKQLAVLNNPANFYGLSGSANASKGPKTFEEWTMHISSNTPVDPSFRTRMITQERMVSSMLQSQIDNMLCIHPDINVPKAGLVTLPWIAK